MTPKEKSKELIKTFQIPANHSHISDGANSTKPLLPAGRIIQQKLNLKNKYNGRI